MMFLKSARHLQRSLLAFTISTGLPAFSLWAGAATASQDSSAPAAANWQSPARLHHGLRSTPGTLTIDANGVEFRSERGLSLKWPFVEIQTFDLVAPRRLVLASYENRGRHFPGNRKFRFDLSSPIPPAVASSLAERVGKPVRNGAPEPQLAGFATIPARHRTSFGGTNGTLRFRDDGIDYLAAGERGGRSWRWSDIQTLANPDPYHFRVAAYRETFEFELKQPMSPELFDHLWDHVYARELNVSPRGKGM